MILSELRRVVCEMNRELPKNALVVWTSGNVSARDPETGHVVIKPSGVMFDDLTPENIENALDVKVHIMDDWDTLTELLK